MDTAYRALPTPEQICAHGEGGLWGTEGSPYPSQYKFWSDRSKPWFDCKPWCHDGQPWPLADKALPTANQWRPLNPDGSPRDWAEIDAIVATCTTVADAVQQASQRILGGTVAVDERGYAPAVAISSVPSSTATPEFRQLSHEIVEANPGQLWDDSWKSRVWRLAFQEGDLADFSVGSIKWSTRENYIDFPWSKKEWRPLTDNHKLMQWSDLKPTLPKNGDPMTVEGAVAIAREGARQALQEINTSAPIITRRIWSPQGVCNIRSLTYNDRLEPAVAYRGNGQTLGAYIATASLDGDITQLPRVFDLVVETTQADKTHIDILVGCRRNNNRIAHVDCIIRHGKTLLCAVPRMPIATLQTVSGSGLDCFAAAWYNITRNPNETDEQLRQRCRDLWTAQEKPMATQPTQVSFTVSTTPALPDFAKMSPEDRARYRAALDAVDPPTTRDAIRSGLEHAPVEIALDKLHNFVAKLANLWTEGSEEDRQTAARFLRDMVGSDYGKAAIGLAAGAALPHAAPLANKLLPDDKDAAPLLRRIGYILAERGAATGAKQLGLDVMDATGPIVTELRNLLGELLSGMRKAEVVAGFLPPASKPLSFDGALTVESAEIKP